jgi:sugar lactone lactonase YvrE
VLVGADGGIWVADAFNNQLLHFSGSGTQWAQDATVTGSGATAFDSPGAMALDPAGNLWVADAGGGSTNGAIQEVLHTSGGWVPQAPITGRGSAAYSSPLGISTDAAGNLWTVDITTAGAWHEATPASPPSTTTTRPSTTTTHPRTTTTGASTTTQHATSTTGATTTTTADHLAATGSAPIRLLASGALLLGAGLAIGGVRRRRTHRP